MQSRLVVTDVSVLICPIFKCQVTVSHLKMGLKRCPETSITNYQSTLRTIPEERRFHLHLGWSLKFRILSTVLHYLWKGRTYWFSRIEPSNLKISWVFGTTLLKMSSNYFPLLTKCPIFFPLTNHLWVGGYIFFFKVKKITTRPWFFLSANRRADERLG